MNNLTEILKAVVIGILLGLLMVIVTSCNVPTEPQQEKTCNNPIRVERWISHDNGDSTLVMVAECPDRPELIQ